jgi:hypothetical protein
MAAAWLLTAPSPVEVTSHSTKKLAVSKPAGELDLALLQAPPFPRLQIAPRDIFLPALLDSPDGVNPIKGSDQIPAEVAGGDSNWVYTGLAEIDGNRQALLENETSHQSGFVHAGDTWKKSRVVSISPDSIAFISPEGFEHTVLRYIATDKAAPGPTAKSAGEPGPMPLMPGPPGMNGPIGQPMPQGMPQPAVSMGG